MHCEIQENFKPTIEIFRGFDETSKNEKALDDGKSLLPIF